MIRPATQHDIDAILDLAERMHAESPRFNWMTFSRARLRATLEALLGTDTGFLWVAEDEGVYGWMAGIVAQHWACREVVATDLALYVAPERRGGTASVNLVHAYVEWAREHGAAHPQLGITTGIHTDRTVQLYEKLGLNRCGVVMEA